MQPGPISDSFETWLEEIRRLIDKLRAFLRSIEAQRVVYESDVNTYNDLISRFHSLGVSVDDDWYVPTDRLQESPQNVSYVGGTARDKERRIGQGKFRVYAVPAFEALSRELLRRESRLLPATRNNAEPRANPAEVWVIYGRNDQFRKLIFRLLRDVGLEPIEFSEAVARSGSGLPFVLDVVLNEIANAPAIVCLFTPDDYAELREELRSTPTNANDSAESERLKEHGYQPRPNVLLETGMALAAMRDKTLIVSMGRLREISDLGGLHEVRWDDSPAIRLALVNRLEAMGCPVNKRGRDWLE